MASSTNPEQQTGTNADPQADTLRLELRRGSLPLAVLGALREEFYGYTLRQHLAGLGLEIEESSLYPLLRRLETQGLLTSEWREHEKRNKRFYRLSRLGVETLARLLGEWRAINQSLGRIVGDAAEVESRGGVEAAERPIAESPITERPIG